MPVINDATVINQPYQTSASTRPQVLSNGWLVTAVKDGTYLRLYISKNNQATWEPFGSYWTSYSSFAFSLESKGTTIFLGVAYGSGTSHVTVTSINALTHTDATAITLKIIDTQTSWGSMDLTTNEAGTELHATWSSRNATYQNSFNIRYAKGTINADGSVTWDAVEQVTTNNTAGLDWTSPSLATRNNEPVILTQYKNGATINAIVVLHLGSTVVMNFVKTGWTGRYVYDGGTYAQSSPSAIFVPQSINGLANGRIWVAWHGKDSAASTTDNIRVSYSDDAGVTWSAMEKLTTSVQTNHEANPTLTANSMGEVFILWDIYSATTATGNPQYSYRIKSIKYSNNSWGTISQFTSGTNANRFPSAIYDLSVKFTEPLFIYKSDTKVGFYGTWTVTTISVTQGSIGTKTSPSPLLEYAITTDGTMSTITEKVNGVTIGTKTATSGQSLIAGLTQAQWDAVRFGKYGDATTSTNILSINASDWVQGYWGNTLAHVASTTHIKTISPIPVQESASYEVKVPNGYSLIIREVDANGLVVVTNLFATNGTFTIAKGVKTLYGHITNGATIVPSNIVSINPTIKSTYFSNTLTVEMGSEKWTYTFDKRLATDADILSAVKAAKDSNEVYLPSVKSKLASAIRAKGGTVNDADALEVMASAVGGIPTPKKASGTVVGNASNQIIVTGLSFRPAIVYVFKDTSSYVYTQDTLEPASTNGIAMASGTAQTLTRTISSDGFTINMPGSNAQTYRYYVWGL